MTCILCDGVSTENTSLSHTFWLVSESLLLTLLGLGNKIVTLETGSQWGNDGIKVDFAIDGTSITSNLGDSQVNYEGVLPVGCNTDNITAETNQETAIKFSGYMSASFFQGLDLLVYSCHDKSLPSLYLRWWRGPTFLNSVES